MPFQRIGLSLSGGGYRAAAFHLGTLDLLERLGLLAKVSALSTVSGGSICGARYALSLVRGEPFDDFFQDFSRYLARSNVVAAAVRRLRAPGDPSSPRGRTLINAAADEYAAPALFGDTPLGAVFAARTHVEDWIFNATEFHSGIGFRFLVSRNPAAKIGNGTHFLSRELAGRIRLADVVAASSCFPGAFEPLVFPRDFVWPEDGGPPEVIEELALMDGGIHDNQGIEGLLLAHARAAPGQGFDLFLVSDTHRARSGLFIPETPSPRSGPRLKQLHRAAEAFVAVCGLGGVALGIETVSAWHERGFQPLDLLSRVLPVLLALAIAGGIPQLWAWIQRELRRQIPEMSEELWQTLAELRLGEVIRLLNVRARSLVTMTADVFMKRVRGLSYERLFREVGSERLNLSNLIYDLESASFRADAGPVPSSAQLEVARLAGDVKTALWLDRGEEDLRALIACAHSTLCLNLLNHLARRWPDPEARPTAVARLQQQLRSLWSELTHDPYALLSRPRGTLTHTPDEQLPRVIPG